MKTTTIREIHDENGRILPMAEGEKKAFVVLNYGSGNWIINIREGNHGGLEITSSEDLEDAITFSTEAEAIEFADRPGYREGDDFGIDTVYVKS